ncbi:hypothetical protein COMA2_240040 [Candidatus Nitrospira nitrificans]|uniref:Uncharacterized protein n=1 Tax=Candidatus Nitrospira nitrificans TaxID=1742973 RepID=A0A0S4LNC2_9BACT|nr:hypothetical protein COMA2_240040 [Candidatus Nitrospira nitrificans]
MLKKSASVIPRLAEAASRGRSHRLVVGEAYLVKRAEAVALVELRFLALGFAAPSVDAAARRARWGGRVKCRPF